jgi:hypothetical protein
VNGGHDALLECGVGFRPVEAMELAIEALRRFPSARARDAVFRVTLERQSLEAGRVAVDVRAECASMAAARLMELELHESLRSRAHHDARRRRKVARAIDR